MDRNRGGLQKTKTTKQTNIMDIVTLLAEAAPAAFAGKPLYVAAAALGGGLGIGLLGSKAAEATGRNPGAAQQILVLAIILAALIEGIFILSAFAV